MEVQRALGIVIGRVRREQGLSELLLSEKAALHLNAIQAIELGKYTLKVTTVFRVARGGGALALIVVEVVEGQSIGMLSGAY